MPQKPGTEGDSCPWAEPPYSESRRRVARVPVVSKRKRHPPERMPFLQSGYQGGALTVVERVLSVPLNLCIERQLLRPAAVDPSRRASARRSLKCSGMLAWGELIVITTTTNPALFHDPQSVTEIPDSRPKQSTPPPPRSKGRQASTTIAPARVPPTQRSTV